MARLPSQQDDFVNQSSMLESVIKKAGHECLFLPKFHCELNPIEMVGEESTTILYSGLMVHFSIGDGASTGTGKLSRKTSIMPKLSLSVHSMPARSKQSVASSTSRGALLTHIGRV